MNQTDINLILPDIPRLYTALAEWLACILCILEMKRRINGWKLALTSAGALILQAAFLTLTKELGDFWWILCMAAAVGLMYLFLFRCCDTHLRDIGYYCVRAFVIAELAASLEWQIDCYFYYTMNWQAGWLRVLLLVVIYAAVFFTAWVLYRKTTSGEDGLQITSKELTACIIIGLAVFLMSNLGFVSNSTPFAGHQTAEIFNVRTLIDLGGAAILYAYHIQRIDLRTKLELESVQNILHNQYIQYQQSQEAMDIINYKYHDLKHHIIALKSEGNDQKRNEYLDKMEEEIQHYEAQNKTGNQVLDTLLTSKNLYCMKNQISMTSVADGSSFGFMDVMDICSIFGNALDNAIECEKKIADPEKRLIHVSAFTQKNFLIIRFENYYEGVLTFDEQLPVTTKKEPQFHGYGLKSLRYTVRKYGGEVDVSAQDNWFNLKILIPLKM
ncbi:sensor histidine kinase [Faecalicatena orotica]|uniref:GHKL domain-containing protein n=1 Tax=Faecalicatena orotica TaxID=1544 RepID=A0A2Y9BBB8_9FIRM|nr:ATP-binding protein [Faecalicatena orotica]PWJ30198.1 GHKL domain-containing protein [Faecalicatena orotica]SSA55187.1 GHKL domain-containing protein [Faecalicatena orotica]